MRTISLVVALLAFTTGGQAREGRQSVAPTIIATGLPMYPAIVRVARVAGVVHVRIRTDGTNVVSATADDGAPLLARVGEENALTWRFQEHAPAEYTLTYTYRLDEKLASDELVVRLRGGLQVEIVAAPIVLSDPPHDPIH
jgi:hypothetical protein